MTNFWNDVKQDPKRQFRWFMSLGADDGTAIETWQLKTAKKPSFTITETPHQYIAHTFYFPGRIQWQPIELTFVDPVAENNKSTAGSLWNILLAGGYKLPTTEEAAKKSFSKANFNTALGSIKITQIDAAAQVIEKWELVNSFATQVDFGQLDYASDELVINSMTVRYDYAIHGTDNSIAG